MDDSSNVQQGFMKQIDSFRRRIFFVSLACFERRNESLAVAFHDFAWEHRERVVRDLDANQIPEHRVNVHPANVVRPLRNDFVNRAL